MDNDEIAAQLVAYLDESRLRPLTLGDVTTWRIGSWRTHLAALGQAYNPDIVQAVFEILRNRQ